MWQSVGRVTTGRLLRLFSSHKSFDEIPCLLSSAWIQKFRVKGKTDSGSASICQCQSRRHTVNRKPPLLSGTEIRCRKYVDHNFHNDMVVARPFLLICVSRSQRIIESRTYYEPTKLVRYSMLNLRWTALFFPVSEQKTSGLTATMI